MLWEPNLICDQTESSTHTSARSALLQLTSAFPTNSNQNQSLSVLQYASCIYSLPIFTNISFKTNIGECVHFYQIFVKFWIINTSKCILWVLTCVKSAFHQPIFKYDFYPEAAFTQSEQVCAHDHIKSFEDRPMTLAVTNEICSETSKSETSQFSW